MSQPIKEEAGVGPHPFRRAMETSDQDALGPLLSPNVALHSPVLNKPFQGKEIVYPLLGFLRSKFEDAHYTDEFSAEGKLALVFRARIGGRRAEGVQILRFDADGLIEEITTMLRPLTAALALSEAVGPYIASMPTRIATPAPDGGQGR